METGRNIIIGDIHGCLAELRALMAKLHLHLNDTLIVDGDLVDKGPDSPGVIKFLFQLSRSINVVKVRGNHCASHLRAWSRQYQAAIVPGSSYSMPPESAALYAALTPAERAFYNDSLSYYRIPRADVVVVHGGIPATLTRLPHPCPAAQTESEAAAARALCYTRHVDGSGRPAGEGRLWAETYDGRFGHAVFGHTQFHFHERRHNFPHATGIDFGCVVGGLLGALVLEGQHRHIVTVPAARRYYWRDHGQATPATSSQDEASPSCGARNSCSTPTVQQEL
jgi:serine/threonine protein phosphatase 1